jgi:hypothetical protein
VGLPHGRGVATYADGGRYDGSLAAGLRDGAGLMQYADGSEHDGGWREGEPHGDGVHVDPAGAAVTRGVWANGELSGACKCDYANGDVYEGGVASWSGETACVRSGHGVCTYANGVRYDGGACPSPHILYNMYVHVHVICCVRSPLRLSG